MYSHYQHLLRGALPAHGDSDWAPPGDEKARAPNPISPGSDGRAGVLQVEGGQSN